jgi:hypothetical protein
VQIRTVLQHAWAGSSTTSATGTVPGARRSSIRFTPRRRTGWNWPTGSSPRWDPAAQQPRRRPRATSDDDPRIDRVSWPHTGRSVRRRGLVPTDHYGYLRPVARAGRHSLQELGEVPRPVNSSTRPHGWLLLPPGAVRRLTTPAGGVRRTVRRAAATPTAPSPRSRLDKPLSPAPAVAERSWHGAGATGLRPGSGLEPVARRAPRCSRSGRWRSPPGRTGGCPVNPASAGTPGTGSPHHHGHRVIGQAGPGEQHIRHVHRLGDRNTGGRALRDRRRTVDLRDRPSRMSTPLPAESAGSDAGPPAS